MPQLMDIDILEGGSITRRISKLEPLVQKLVDL
jgi:hypothetical protein